VPLAPAVRRLLLASLIATACTGDDGPVTELDSGPPLGKDDSAGIPALPIAGDYAATQAWVVANQWEDTDTPDAQLAGIAWPAQSGLTWDQKFAAWVGSLEQTPNMDGTFTTVKISTPFGKAVPGPKIDCADTAIMLRMSFAAWYHLPFYLVGYDGGTPVFFGHFGVRTATGQWSKAPAYAQYADDSTMPPEQYTASWPQDSALRTRGISPGDELPFLGPHARLGAFLDEIHLNKRAARLVMFAQAYLGSHNMVDARNVYNLVPESVRTGDVLMFARAPNVDGHTTIVTRVTQLGGGLMQAESIYGNDPPAQPEWQNPGSTLSLFTDPEGGGPDLNTAYGGHTPFSHLGGGLKRFRVAKPVAGKWMNTWMNADEASWIDSTSFDAIAARPARFKQLLGSTDPAAQRDQLLSVIADKRTYLQSHPSSCAARTDREQAFATLYGVMQQSFNTSQAAVDAHYRTIDDYVFAPLAYAQSRTCCWNHTTAAMYQIIMQYETSQSASGCVAPTLFAMKSGGYDPFASFAQTINMAAAWGSWSADEQCDQQNATDDVALAFPATPWCSLPQNMAPGM
jgi:hypothetical protein